MCADRNRFADVGAAAERPVDDHLGPTSRRVDDAARTAFVASAAAIVRKPLGPNA
jgi:hypothetical protein